MSVKVRQTCGESGNAYGTYKSLYRTDCQLCRQFAAPIDNQEESPVLIPSLYRVSGLEDSTGVALGNSLESTTGSTGNWPNRDSKPFLT